jgi:hypothetical protein
LCQNMDKASPSILTLQFRSSQGMLLPDTVQMRATIRRHNQGPGTHDPSEMRPLSQWFVDLQELISGGDTIKLHGVRLTCGPVYTCAPLLKVRSFLPPANLPGAKQFHHALISTALQELFEHSARKSLEFALSPPIPNPPLGPVPRVPHFLENIGSDVWALAKSTEKAELSVGNTPKQNDVMLNLRALLHLNDVTDILMSRQEGPDGRIVRQNQSHLKSYLDLRSIEDLYRSLERIAVEDFILSGGAFLQTSSGGSRLNRQLAIQCTADELSQPVTFDIDHLLLVSGAYLPKNLSFEKLCTLFIVNAHPVHPEFVWRCQKAGIQNVSLWLARTHYLPDVLLPLSRSVCFSDSLLLSNVRACQGWLSHCGGTHVRCEHCPVGVVYDKAHPLALRISCLPYTESWDYLANPQDKLKGYPVRFPAGLSWHQQREILRALRVEGISTHHIFKEGVTAEEERDVSQLWDEIALTVVGFQPSSLTQKDFDDAPLDKVFYSALVVSFYCPEVLQAHIPDASPQRILMSPVILWGGDRSAYANFIMQLWRRDGEVMTLFENLLVNGIMPNHQTPEPVLSQPVEPEQPAPASDEPSAA